MDEETKSNLLDTKIDDMTVGDSLKLQVYILAGMAGAVGLYAGGVTLYDKLSTWRRTRKLEKALKAEETPSDDE